MGHGIFKTTQPHQHMDHTFAVQQGLFEQAAQLAFVVGVHYQVAHGQLNVVLFEAVNAREVVCG